MVVCGRMAGPDGKPIGNGQVAVLVYSYCRSEKPEWINPAWPGLMYQPRLLAAGKTDEEGRFRLTGPGCSPALPYTLANLVAGAPGYGTIWRSIDPVAARQELSVELQPERVIRGRLIDLQGQPAAGVKVHLLRSANLFGHDSDLVPFWPKPVTSDDKGRFFFRGRLSQDGAAVEIHHDRFAPDVREMEAVSPEDKTEATLSLVATRQLRGRVLFADTGKPAAGARLSVALYGGGGRTDEQGRFGLNVFPADSIVIVVHPPEDSPYLMVERQVPWAQAAKNEVKLDLPRGVLVRGRVTESPSGKPVAGARVQFRPRMSNNPFNSKPMNEQYALEESLATAISGDDGRFQLAVLPGPGHLFVLGPTLDYLHAETSFGELEYKKAGGIRYYPDALVPLDLKPETKADEVAVQLRRGVTLTGRVLSPDGKPVDRFAVICRSYIPTGYQWWHRSDNLLQGRDGRFELPGCDPDKPFTALFFDAANKWGAIAELPRQRAARAPLTVRLQPCVSAVARFVEPDGKPLANYSLSPLTLLVTPGIQGSMPYPSQDAKYKTKLEADEFGWLNLWRGVQAPMNLQTDAQGRITFPALVPGATYRLVVPKTRGAFNSTDGWPTYEFSVKAGETLKLPDLVHVRFP
jgi:hypothetical protein